MQIVIRTVALSFREGVLTIGFGAQARHGCSSSPDVLTLFPVSFHRSHVPLIVVKHFTLTHVCGIRKESVHIFSIFLSRGATRSNIVKPTYNTVEIEIGDTLRHFATQNRRHFAHCTLLTWMVNTVNEPRISQITRKYQIITVL